MPTPPPFPPKPDAGAPSEGGAAAEAEAGTEKMLGAATEAGVTKPLDDLAAEEGLECTGADLLKYAQDIPELHGKSVDDIATALRGDPDLLQEVVDRKQGDKPEGDGAPAESFEDVKKRLMSSIPDDESAEGEM